MTRLLRSVLLALVLWTGLVTPSWGQWVRAAAGAGIGVAGGAVVTISAIVFRARFQEEYIDSVEDLIHWQSTPMIAAPAAGIAFGIAGREAQVGSIIGSTSGMVAGAAIGAGMGWLLSDQQESPWAGGVIGAGLGLTVGGIAGGLIGLSRRSDDENGAAAPDAVRIGFSLPAR